MAIQQMPGEEKHWLLDCNVCGTRFQPTSAIRGAVICNAILAGWQVGYGDFLCPGCMERRGINQQRPRGERASHGTA